MRLGSLTSCARRRPMRGGARTRGPGLHEMRAEAAATKEQRLVGRAFLQGLGGQAVARKVGPGRKGPPCTKPAC